MNTPALHTGRLSRKAFPGCAFLVLAASALCGQPAEPLQTAVLQTRADIAHETEALNRLRAEIAAERAPLAARLESLQRSVATRRLDAERLRHAQTQAVAEQAAGAAAAEAADEECRFLGTLFSEYARAMEAQAGEAESAWLAERLPSLREALDTDGACEGLAARVSHVLDLALEWNTRGLGGAVFSGVALDAAGLEHRGSFAAFGPITYFAADQGGAAGLAVTRFGSAQPAIYDRLDPDVADGIRRVIAGETAALPVDVSGGDAIKVAEARPSLGEHLRKGGVVMIPLLLVGLLAAGLTLWKAIELHALRIRAGDAAQRAVTLARSGRREEALRLAAGLREPLAALVGEAIRHHDAPRDHLEELLHEQVLGCLPRLERHLGTLAVLGGVAPLLGLLGTVTGMIHTFQLVTVFGSGDAKLLSGGISEALITTEFGLAIAIPVLVAHAFLARRAHGIIGALERTALTLVNDLNARGGQP